MLTVLCWKWKRADGPDLFGPEYVNRLRSMLARHVHVAHRIVCVTDDAWGIDPAIQCEPIREFVATPRCRRRMKQYDGDFASRLGERILSIDLDVVILDDITAIVQRSEPVVCWRVGYAGVYSGSFVLYDARVLDRLYRTFASDPEGFPRTVQPRGVPSDQAMLNFWLARHYRGPLGVWTEADGFVTWFGKGYERQERFGMGPGNPVPPAGARIVVLGSADKAVLDEQRFDFVCEHWR